MLLILTACEGTLPPLRGVAEVGRDAIVVFVGGQGQAGGDLFAVLGSGGQVIPLTYTNVGEMRPALSPDGGAVAFLRGGSLSDSTPGSVWVMNLLSGAEREVSLPEGAGPPTRVGWAKDGRSLVVAAGSGLYRAPAPPAEGDAKAIPPGARVAAESSLAVLLGRPAFGRAVGCENSSDLCVLGDSGAPALLAKGTRDAARWGGDSVAYFMGDALLVRPLGPGRERRVRLEGGPARPREPTVFAGQRR
ncbi:MAG: hypothetical protein H0T68_05090 [Gemmatimonadales bacterium]|nr:hypothetical protein [Gemmatimonadales bacterium]